MNLAATLAALESKIRPVTLDKVRDLVREAPDHQLNRINPLRFAFEHNLTEPEVIGAFVRATDAGLFDMNWSVLCPRCAGTLFRANALKNITKDSYQCALCEATSAPVLDENVEVTFTVSPRMRKIVGHEPDSLSFWEFAQQVCWSSGVELPSDTSTVMGGAVLDTVVLHAQESLRRQIMVDFGRSVVFDLVSHSAQFLDARGAKRESVEDVSFEIGDRHLERAGITLRPGPVAIHFRNSTSRRALPIVLHLDEAFEDMVRRRYPILTAKRLLTDQTFRDVYRTDVLSIDQRLKITSLTFLFTDIKGSTELYERIGDLAAYDLIRAHFRILEDIVRDDSGSIVKTIGDSVMATFPTPIDAFRAALHMRQAMAGLNARHHREDIILKIGLHVGPCLAVYVNERQDYFGHTVNVASRLQGLAKPLSILTTKTVVDDEACSAMIREQRLVIKHERSALRGIHEKLETYEIS
jgi:class 3 adenylate cyclase